MQLALLFDAPASAPSSATAATSGHTSGVVGALDRSSSPAECQAQAPTPDHPGAPRARRLALGQGLLDYRLRRARRRTIGFQIDDNGLTVSAPRWVTVMEIEAAISEKQRWIHRKLVEWRTWRDKRAVKEVRFIDGGTLPYLGVEIVLRLKPSVGRAQLHRCEVAASGAREAAVDQAADADATAKADAKADADGVCKRAQTPDELWLPLPAQSDEQRVRDAVQAWLQNEARRVLAERLALISQRIEVKPASWRLSSARSQWGACTSDGRIRLNWRLVHFALPIIDYVVAHELAHLKELNHGPRFWNAVAELLPGFETARDQIKAVDLAALPV